MIVGEYRVRVAFQVAQDRLGAADRGGGEDLAAPAGEHGLHALEDQRLIVDTDHARAGELVASATHSGLFLSACLPGGHRRYGHREDGADAFPGADPDRMVQHPAHAIGDRQPEAESLFAFLVPRGLVEAAELLKDFKFLFKFSLQQQEKN